MISKVKGDQRWEVRLNVEEQLVEKLPGMEQPLVPHSYRLSCPTPISSKYTDVRPVCTKLPAV